MPQRDLQAAWLDGDDYHPDVLRAFDENGLLAYQDFVETVNRLMPLYWIRVAGGSLYTLWDEDGKQFLVSLGLVVARGREVP